MSKDPGLAHLALGREPPDRETLQTFCRGDIHGDLEYLLASLRGLVGVIKYCRFRRHSTIVLYRTIVLLASAQDYMKRSGRRGAPLPRPAASVTCPDPATP